MQRKLFTTANLVKIGLLSALAFILMYLEFPLPFFPPFLRMDFSDVPALIGGFYLGPVAGILIELIKNVIFLITKTDTGLVGPAANFITGISLVVPASLIYRRIRSKKGALLGMVVGTLSMATVMAVANYFIVFPLYMIVFDLTEETLVAMGAALNSNITDLRTLIVLSATPFNLIKGVLVSIITLVLYKHISTLFKRI